MWENIYRESLESSVVCKYELELKKLSVREICFLKKKKKREFFSFNFLFNNLAAKGVKFDPSP